jgi:hypothetical protein
MLRKVLMATVVMGGLFTLATATTQAAPATGLQGIHAPSAVTQADYYWNHHHWHHRRWYHHHWHYWD